MPTYEYECKKCGHRFEKFQSMKDEALKVCERCGGELRRLIGAGAGFLFKGSGFYQTDYRSESYRRKAKEETGGAKKPESEKKPDAKSESKPAPEKEGPKSKEGS